MSFFPASICRREDLPAVFGADGEFLDQRGKRERDWPPFAPMSKVLEPFGMESETLFRAGSEAPWGIKVRFLTEAMTDMAWV